MICLEGNRSLNGWSTYGEGSMNLSSNEPLSKALPVHLKYSFRTNSTSRSGLLNSGFYGINVQIQTYNCSFFYKRSSTSFLLNNKLSLGFRNRINNQTYGQATIDVSSARIDSWTKFNVAVVVNISANTTENDFFIEFPLESNGDFELNLISCFPRTYKDRANGARIDIAQAFADLKPGFIRLPGGNDLEGHSIAGRFIWNQTIGPLEDRPGRLGTWTGYNTEGFGLIELMTFAEDIGATPILDVYAGYSLDQISVPKDKLQPYIDEVIDEIDFLIAPANESRMGALRASLGRVEPFDIKYVEIGNEDWAGLGLITYRYRWPAYYDALSKRYPNMTFIATTTELISSPPAADDHHYRGTQFFIDNFRHYEQFDRSSPKRLIGEFAAVEEIYDATESILIPYPTVKTAVAESVYRIGFERNSDIVLGGCYAPLLQNVADTQWTPNFILFNANTLVKSTAYLAQQMFGQYLGNILLNSTAYNHNNDFERCAVKKGEEGDGKLGHLYFVATKQTDNNTLIVKLASVDSDDILVNIQIQNSSLSTHGTVYMLSAGVGIDPAKVSNTLQNPNAAAINTTSIDIINGTCAISIPSWSVIVLTVHL